MTKDGYPLVHWKKFFFVNVDDAKQEKCCFKKQNTFCISTCHAQCSLKSTKNIFGMKIDFQITTISCQNSLKLIPDCCSPFIFFLIVFLFESGAPWISFLKIDVLIFTTITF